MEQERDLGGGGKGSEMPTKMKEDQVITVSCVKTKK